MPLGRLNVRCCSFRRLISSTSTARRDDSLTRRCCLRMRWNTIFRTAVPTWAKRWRDLMCIRRASSSTTIPGLLWVARLQNLLWHNVPTALTMTCFARRLVSVCGLRLANPTTTSHSKGFLSFYFFTLKSGSLLRIYFFSIGIIIRWTAGAIASSRRFLFCGRHGHPLRCCLKWSGILQKLCIYLSICSPSHAPKGIKW